jgi:hypothetical protein
MIREKGLHLPQQAIIFAEVAATTNFVEKVVFEVTRDEDFWGYRGPWRLRPEFKPLVEELLVRTDPSSF